MSRLQYQCSMSLDGFIAGPGGDMAWLVDYLGPNPAADEVMHDTGALLVGRRTYGGDDPHKGTEHQGEPYGGGWHGQQFVLTHRLPDTSPPGITFVDDLGSAVAQAKAAAGGKCVGVLGAEVAGQCLAAGLLDEICVFIAPVLLGDGVRLFDAEGGRKIKLERRTLTQSAESTNLLFRVLY